MGFLKFLFIAILVLWIIRLIVSSLLPWILRRFASKMQERVFKEFQGQGKYQQHADPRQEQTKPEGKINIEYIPPQQPNTSGGPSKAGEFVDFEEIK